MNDPMCEMHLHHTHHITRIRPSNLVARALEIWWQAASRSQNANSQPAGFEPACQSNSPTSSHRGTHEPKRPRATPTSLIGSVPNWLKTIASFLIILPIPPRVQDIGRSLLEKCKLATGRIRTRLIVQLASVTPPWHPRAQTATVHS